MRSRIEEFGHHHPVLGKVIALVFFLSMLAVPWLAGGVRAVAEVLVLTVVGASLLVLVIYLAGDLTPGPDE